jgi:hypothetical protein
MNDLIIQEADLKLFYSLIILMVLTLEEEAQAKQKLSSLLNVALSDKQQLKKITTIIKNSLGDNYSVNYKNLEKIIQ